MPFPRYAFPRLLSGRAHIPVHTDRGERFLLVGAELITFKLRGPEYSVFENATQAGYSGPPPYWHLRQDEGFYVLEGQFTFHVEGQAIRASAGTFVNIPKGSLHTFQTREAGVGRLLGIVTPPGDFERFVEEVGEIRQASIACDPQR